MGIINNYEPKDVFGFFEEICSIPHGSYNVKRISDYLVSFANERNLKVIQDDALNVIIYKPAQHMTGEPVIIQGHMDMVAVKTDSSDKDLEKEGLELEVNGDYITARDTSLGGDDGIAVAYALALLDSKDIPHPPLEVVITVNEEVGMLGADALDASVLSSKMMLNIDSEDEGVFTVSCAGGQCNICHIPVSKKEYSGETVKICISGLKGGHSGVDINKGRLNANVLAGRLCKAVTESSHDANIGIVKISGGEKDNAIARFSEVILHIGNEATTDKAINALKAEYEAVKKEYSSVEPDIKMDIHRENGEGYAIIPEDSKKIIDAIISLPDGVVRMNPDMDGMVQTSLNMGVISTNNEEIVITTLLRSSNDSEKEYLSKRVEAIVSCANGYIEYQGVYPGWNYKPESRLRDIMVQVYENQYGEKPVVEGIHAGLECGLFASKIEGLDCISFGPQINDIHTTNEALSISSVKRTWELIKETLLLIK